jgi:ERF superfamily
MTIVIDPECLAEAPEEVGTPAQIAELYAALAAVQAELPSVKKNHVAEVKNQEGRLLYTYTYADLDDVSEAILPVLGRHGLAFTCLPGHQPDGKFGLPYKLVHRSGASLEGFWAIPEQGGIQMIGGRITYARRYCLCAVTGITAGEDTDAREDAPARSPRPQNASPAPPQAPHAATTPDSKPAERAGEAQDTAPAAPEGPPAEPAAGAAPDDADHGDPGTVTPKQLTKIWATLTGDFAFSHDAKDQAREACSIIVMRKLGSSKDLSHDEASVVIDTLSHALAQAQNKGEQPYDYLLQLLAVLEADRQAGTQAAGT